MSDSREYPSRPFVGVGVVVLKDDQVLLIRRGRPPRVGEWSLPGGAQQVGETVQETAIREVLEETRIQIRPPHFLEVIDSITPDAQGKVRYHYTLIDFWAEWQAGIPQGEDDALHAEWISLASLCELNLWEKTIEVIQKAQQLRQSMRSSKTLSKVLPKMSEYRREMSAEQEFQEKLEKGKILEVARSIGLPIDLFQDTRMASLYHTHQWVASESSQVGPVLNAIPDLSKTDQIPWEEWFVVNGQIKHHVLFTRKHEKSNMTWRGEADDLEHPKEVLGIDWYAYNDDPKPFLLK